MAHAGGVAFTLGVFLLSCILRDDIGAGVPGTVNFLVDAPWGNKKPPREKETALDHLD